MTADELKQKSVINVSDASDYGCPSDFRIDACSGSITHIIVSRNGGAFSFSKCDEIEIPWCAVVRIGEGAILVDVPVPVPRCEECDRPRKKRKLFF